MSRTKRYSIDSFDESRTHQSFKDECDMNNIVKKYKRSGIVTHVTNQIAQFGDFTNVPDYHTAMNIVSEAQQSFDQLPAIVRKRFANDPAQFMDFIHNPDNLEEMKNLGLTNPEISAPNVAPLQGSKSDNTSPLGDSTSGST